MDISALRSDTPGTRTVLHLNNAGASLMPDPVLDTVTDYLSAESLYGGYEAAEMHRGEIEGIYRAIGSLINAEPGEIALVENATAAWNMGFFSIDFQDGDRILTSVSEYASNYINYLRLQQDVNVRIEVIPSTSGGETSPSELEKMMDDRVKLIGITHMPTNSGLINPVEEIGKVARQHDCLYLVDACQSVGQYPIDVERIGCDLLSATGRKYLRGPRGTGFLYVSRSALPKLHPPFLDLRAATWTTKDKYTMRHDARRFENWEFNYAAFLGLKRAVQYAADIGITDIRGRIRNLSGMLRSRLSEVNHLKVQDIGTLKSGIVTFISQKCSPQTLKEKLSRKKINVSVSSSESTLLDMTERDLESVVRASIHYYNTREEIDRFVAELQAPD